MIAALGLGLGRDLPTSDRGSVMSGNTTYARSVAPIASSIPRSVWSARTALIGSAAQTDKSTAASRLYSTYTVGARSSISTYLPLSAASPTHSALETMSLPGSRQDRSRSMMPLRSSRLGSSASDYDDDVSVRSDSWNAAAFQQHREGKSMDSSNRVSDVDMMSDIGAPGEETKVDVFSGAEGNAERSAALSAVIDAERKKLEALVQAPVSKMFVFVLGDLNYRLDLNPDQAIRAIARAANDLVRLPASGAALLRACGVYVMLLGLRLVGCCRISPQHGCAWLRTTSW